MKNKSSQKNKSRYQYLAGNIALFSVSNFVSKILVFLLVPLYTNVLTTEEYGVADIMQVTLLLLVPALTVNMGEAALRFGIEKKESRGSILNIGLKYVLRADVFVALVSTVGMIVFAQPVRWYILLFIFLFCANSLYEYLILYFQGCEMVPVVVIGSVFSTLVMILSNILFLLVIRIGLYGYIFSQIISFALASAVMLILWKMGKDDAKSGNAEDNLEKEMVSYGIPMIAYSTGSWVNNAADRYIVAGICGSAANGIYGVAYKIPAILMVFQRIFAQAWQMSATKSYSEDTSEEFFTQMYRIYNTFMVMGCACLIFAVRFIAAFMFRKEFYTAWTFVPPLLISVIFGALTGFLGSICLAYKDSKSMGIATGTGAVLNIILNLCSVPVWGAMGAAWATAASYCTMCFMAYYFVRRYVRLKNMLVKEIAGYVLLVAEAVIMIAGGRYVYLFCGLIVVILAAMYFGEVKNIITKLSGVIAGKVKGRGN